MLGVILLANYTACTERRDKADRKSSIVNWVLLTGKARTSCKLRAVGPCRFPTWYSIDTVKGGRIDRVRLRFFGSSCADVAGKAKLSYLWTAIAFVQCVVPNPDKVSSFISLLSKHSIANLPDIMLLGIKQ